MKIFNVIYHNSIEGESMVIPCASLECAIKEATEWFELEPEEAEVISKNQCTGVFFSKIEAGDGFLIIEEEELRS